MGIKIYNPCRPALFDLYVDGNLARVFRVEKVVMGKFTPGFYLEKLIPPSGSYEKSRREFVKISYEEAISYQSGIDPETQLFL